MYNCWHEKCCKIAPSLSLSLSLSLIKIYKIISHIQITSHLNQIIFGSTKIDVMKDWLTTGFFNYTVNIFNQSKLIVIYCYWVLSPTSWESCTCISPGGETGPHCVYYRTAVKTSLISGPLGHTFSPCSDPNTYFCYLIKFGNKILSWDQT